MADLLVYGSYGYTGSLVVEEAVDRGLDVIVAGRDRDAVENLAIRQGCGDRVFALDERRVLDLALEEVPVVLNCAGPFVDTYRPLVEGCLRTGTHYLDITGEIEVFEAIAAMDERASEAGVMLLPGVGFDVVPTDCLAAHLRDLLATAPAADDGAELTHLRLGFRALGSMSPGTARTFVRSIDAGGAIRRDGVIEAVPAAWRTRAIDFGDGEGTGVTIPWGDVSTAYYTTGVPNVEVYMAVSTGALWGMRAARYLGPLLGIGPVTSLLESLVDSTVEGPDADARASGRSDVWGELETADGRRAVSRLSCPETYRLTRHAAVTAVERVLGDEAAPGFATPGGAFGADFVLEVPETERTDDPITTTGSADGDEQPT